MTDKPEQELKLEPESVSESESESESDHEPELKTAPTKGDVEFSYEPGKISLKFLFANRDGLHVRIQCDAKDTVSTVKASLLSMWPEELENCSEGARIRLICMGKGILQPDGITLEQCDIPVFKTHATPVNVSIKPSNVSEYGNLTSKSPSLTPGNRSNSANASTDGCCCVVQ
mmetsp:Transcript_15540/g.18436  ORF Transcript_15540/g.18436 Transcript_15540/m.18436 type:complete len:173 (+) Transcript_15540:149-667(+)|eukprot:CAMPEP_0198256710 /NCGR_PEP_ID=MMETSP1447-20131203/6548_1 /TAXON_ID=420782 /ORGANISM="Chaetoceros dichaeta, Strain CCMP1751" /LENGTH=172 /DNA_ID=CAMNT_0043943407 /DNA_START=103 /DNA_END=621 /DNA_ORIENTATION=+